MTLLTRRASLLGLLAAPVIIRTAGLLMPVRRVEFPELATAAGLDVGDWLHLVLPGEAGTWFRVTSLTPTRITPNYSGGFA